MKVDLITETNSDLTVVNAARCSFDKYHTELTEQDIKLIQYLANHQHWTPFAHCQEVYELWLSIFEELEFFRNANLSGFEWAKGAGYLKIRGSLYAWATNVQYLPVDIARDICYPLQQKYPHSIACLHPQYTMDYQSPHGICRVQPVPQPQQPELLSFTLRIHCPIFVKRQLETHKRNFVMTDIADMAQNEVSRRYVDSTPEIYQPKQWRLQSPNKKQGSLGDILSGIQSEMTTLNYFHHTYGSQLYYKAMNRLGIAHEQSRMILPLSTYTTFWWTGSLKSWQRMFTLRLDDHVQSETREIAQMCYDVINSVHPLKKSK